MDKVFIRQLVVPTLIGVMPEERESAQNLLLDLEMQIDVAAAAEKDAVERTVDYSKVRFAVLNFAAKSDYQLIESFAEQLAAFLKFTFALPWVKLTITKQPFDIVDAEGVGVVIER